jgi:hypothetical protein
MRESRNKSKKFVFIGMLLKGEVRLWLEADREGVRLPNELRHWRQVGLLYTPECFPHITDEGVAAMIVVGRAALPTVIPWSAVFLMASQDGGYQPWWEDASPEARKRRDVDFTDAVAAECEPIDASEIFAAGMKALAANAERVFSEDLPMLLPPSSRTGLDDPSRQEGEPRGAKVLQRAPSPRLIAIPGGRDDDKGEGGTQ